MFMRITKFAKKQPRTTDTTSNSLKLHGIAKPFCPSVCPSVKRVNCDKTKENCAYILIAHERSFILVF